MNILENDKRYLNDFIRLNEEWINKYFEVEEADRALAADPYKVVENGGFIFALVEDDKAIGVCALFKENDDNYELARMAVSPAHQGKGIGDILIQTCLSKLKEIGAKRVHLVSNTKLEPAINLYKKHGFETVSLGQHPVYARANIIMERSVS
jgi:N-acetylglutamate synthase-like GNAT family acetyltransferase